MIIKNLEKIVREKGKIELAYNKCRLGEHPRALQSCPSLCDPMDHCPPGGCIHGIFPGMNIYVTGDEIGPVE